MLKIRLIILLLALSMSPFAQGDIDFAPRALTKALDAQNNTGLTEISLPNGSVDQHGKFFRIESHSDGPAFVYVGRVYSCRAGGCSVSTDMTMGFEYFDYFILFDKNYSVQQVKIYNYQATKGHEVTAKSWLKQFIGYDGQESLQVGKDVDTISGATISVYALTADVEVQTRTLRRFMEN